MTRISTNQFYSNSTSRMSSLNVEADRLQTQISTGKKLTVPSQDVSGFARLSNLKRAASDDKAADANMTLAAGILQQSDSTLASMSEQLVRAKELAVRANSGTLTADQRAIIAGQLDEIMNDMTGLANTKDVRGVPMFGGGGEAAFGTGPDGKIAYLGGTTPGRIPTNDGNEVQVTEDGTQLAQVLTTLEALSGAVRDGNDIGGAADKLDAGIDTVSAMRASTGARSMRLDMEMERLKDVGLDREEARTAIEDTDVTAAITQLQKTLTILSATQASFTKFSSLSLFDQLR